MSKAPLDPHEFAFPSGDDGWDGTRGLSVREYIAVQALAALIAAGVQHKSQPYMTLAEISEAACNHADSLIVELNKGTVTNGHS